MDKLMDLIPEMRLCADLSHFVVDRELRLPLPERDKSFINNVLERSDCFQGRIPKLPIRLGRGRGSVFE